MRLRGFASLLAAPLLLSGCEWDWGDWLAGESSRSELTLALSASPDAVQARRVVLRVTGVELGAEGAEATTLDLDRPLELDLLAAGGSSVPVLVDQRVVPAGRYDSIRLLVEAFPNVVDSYVVLEGDDAQRPLEAPASSLTLNIGFTLSAREGHRLTLALDLRRALVNSATGGYALRPGLRLVDSRLAGHISGSVAESVLTAPGCPTSANAAVYLYRGHDAEPDDIRGASTDPLTTAPVTGAASARSYTIRFLAPGDYTLALTCQAGLEDPRRDDDIGFVGRANVTVPDGETLRRDFAAGA